MVQGNLEDYPERRIKLCFKKNLEFFTWAGETVHGPFEKGKIYELPYEAGKAIIKAGFASRELGALSLEKILKEFSDSPIQDFEEQFDRQKILENLRTKSSTFWTEILGKKICPRCKKSIIIPKVMGNSFAIQSYCPACKRSFKKSAMGSQFSNWIISSIMNNFFQGRTPTQAQRSLKIESTNRYLDFYKLLIGGSKLNLEDKERIPKKSAILCIRRNYSRKLRTFNSFMMLLMGGLRCEKILVDDVFLRKSWTTAELERWKKTPKRLRRKLKSKRYSYMIVFLDKVTRFIIHVYTARNRDMLNFYEAFRETKKLVKGSFISFAGDKLWPQIQAARLIYPEAHHDFKVRGIKNKGVLSIIEKRNRDLRETLQKRRKHSSNLVLKELVIIAVIGQNYLHSMKVLNWRTPAQAIGIPYPFDSDKDRNSQCSWNWRVFMIWVDWVCDHAIEILNAGIK